MVNSIKNDAIKGILFDDTSMKPVKGRLTADEVIQGKLNVGIKEIINNGIITVKEKYDLPTMGVSDVAYFVITENAVYRWDEEKLLYFCVGRDYEEINVINGGNANGCE